MRRYRVWAGSRGTPEDVTRCRYEVPDGDRSVLFHQCARKRGFGPDAAYCKQHSKDEQRALWHTPKDDAR